MNQNKIDIGEIIMAMDNISWEVSYYLDVESGQVVMVRSEMRQKLESIYNDIDDPAALETLNIAEAVHQRGLPNWYARELQDIHQVERGYGQRFISIPQSESWQGYRDMEDFISTVTDDRLQNQLWRAIKGRGAFRRFKDVLLDYPTEREQWFAFKDELMRQRVLDWLASEKIKTLTLK